MSYSFLVLLQTSCDLPVSSTLYKYSQWVNVQRNAKFVHDAQLLTGVKGKDKL